MEVNTSRSTLITIALYSVASVVTFYYSFRSETKVCGGGTQVVELEKVGPSAVKCARLPAASQRSNCPARAQGEDWVSSTALSL